MSLERREGMRVEHAVDQFEREKQSISKDKYVYVSRSVEDSRDRKKKKACGIRENLMIGSISRGAEEQLMMEVKQ